MGNGWAYAVASAALRSPFSFAINRDLRRAALFLWMMPLPATRSSTLIAFNTAASEVASSPSAIAASALRTEVRAAVRNGLLRWRRRSATLIRFSDDFLFAKTAHPSLLRIPMRSTKLGAGTAPTAGCYQKPSQDSSGEAVQRAPRREASNPIISAATHWATNGLFPAALAPARGRKGCLEIWFP